MSRDWRWFLPCYVLTLPLTVVGFVLAMVYHARAWEWYDGVLTCVAGKYPSGKTRIIGGAMGQTFGWLQIYDSAENRNYADLRVHENVHVVQTFVCSLLGVLVTPFVFALVGVHPVIGLGLGGFFGSIMFAILYGLFFLFFWIKQGFGNWYFAYRANPFEVHANRHQDEFLADQTTRPWGA